MTDGLRALSPEARFLVALAVLGQELDAQLPAPTERREVCTCCKREPYLCERTHLGNRCPTKVMEVTL